MKLPIFAEAEHPLVLEQMGLTDQELVAALQQYPDQGKYFTTLFCRYGSLSYSLLRNVARSALQVDYVFAQLWRNIFYELRHLSWEDPAQNLTGKSLQPWIVNKIALCVNADEIPAIETIQYSLDAASPPLWCYLQTALEELPPLSRLVLVLSQTCQWQHARIAGVLQAEGEDISATDIPGKLAEAYQALQLALPEDVQAIYGALDLQGT